MIESALLLTKNYEELQEVLLKASKDYADFSKTFRESIKEGTFVDVKDKYNKWRLGTVKSISASGMVGIHFDGWDPKWDEVFSLRWRLKRNGILGNRNEKRETTASQDPHGKVHRPRHRLKAIHF
jgi:hypothetical protein